MGFIVHDFLTLDALRPLRGQRELMPDPQKGASKMGRVQIAVATIGRIEPTKAMEQIQNRLTAVQDGSWSFQGYCNA